MNVYFEIEYVLRAKKQTKKEHILARQIDLKADFRVTDASLLNDIPIENFLSQPRALNEDGTLRLDIFVFVIKHKADHGKLKIGDIVTLNNKGD